MLGPPKPRRLNEPVVVSLEGLILQDNVYRHLEMKLDLSFVRDGVIIHAPRHAATATISWVQKGQRVAPI